MGRKNSCQALSPRLATWLPAPAGPDDPLRGSGPFSSVAHELVRAAADLAYCRRTPSVVLQMHDSAASSLHKLRAVSS
eukprot:11221118-Alexandrium_andersonii.AAC.1